MKVFQKNLVQALKVNQKLKVSGFCFGHQLVAHAFGGRV
jgi:GMP synthase-like glutamine amidotransferase